MSKTIVKWIVGALGLLVVVGWSSLFIDMRNGLRDMQADMKKVNHSLVMHERALTFLANRTLSPTYLPEFREILVTRPVLSSVGERAVFPLTSELRSVGEVTVGPPQPLLRSAKPHIDESWLKSLAVTQQHRVVALDEISLPSEPLAITVPANHVLWVSNQSKSSLEIDLTTVRSHRWGFIPAPVMRFWSVVKPQDSVMLPPLSALILKPTKGREYRVEIEATKQEQPPEAKKKP